MNQEKSGGGNIDTWSLEELETMVVLFKRQLQTVQPEASLLFRLEDLELNDDEKGIYAKKIQTSQKTRTKISQTQAYIFVSQVEVVN